MADCEKVLKGLECCAAMSGDECRKCPYCHECRDTDLPYGMPHLAADALALLKEQEAVPVDTKTTDIITAMSWLEGLTQDDWQKWYSDSEVQETAKAALKVLKGLDVNCKANLA